MNSISKEHHWQQMALKPVFSTGESRGSEEKYLNLLIICRTTERSRRSARRIVLPSSQQRRLRFDDPSRFGQAVSAMSASFLPRNSDRAASRFLLELCWGLDVNFQTTPPLAGQPAMEKLHRASQEARRLRLGTLSEWSRSAVSSFQMFESPMSFLPDSFPLFLVGDLLDIWTT